jgi:hypothetical protein
MKSFLYKLNSITDPNRKKEWVGAAATEKMIQYDKRWGESK